MDDRCYALLAEAIGYEGEYFEDMTLEAYPAIVEALEYENGEFPRPCIESMCFRIAEDMGGSAGECDMRRREISIAEEHLNDKTVILHEMIHFYEHTLNDRDCALRDYILAKLWQKLSPGIPDLKDRVDSFVGEWESDSWMIKNGGTHSILFLLKSLDLDQRLNVPLGTVFGYGMTEGQ